MTRRVMIGCFVAACLLIVAQFAAAADFRIRGKEVVALDARGAEIDTLPLEGIPESLALSPDRSTVYVRLADQNSIAVFDAKSLSLTGWFSLDRAVRGMKLDPTYWYVDPVGGRLVFRTTDGRTVFADEYRNAARLAEAPSPVPIRLAAGADFDLSALSGAKDSPSADFDSVGNFAATWTDLAGHDGGGEGVYIREFDSGGSPQAAEFVGNKGKSGDQGNSTLACAANGDYVVVWRDSSGQDGDGFGVFGRRFSNGGNPKDSNDIKIPNTTNGNQKEPSVDVESGGDFVAVWIGPSGGNKGIFARRFSANGSPKANEQVVDTSGSENAPRVATNTAGRFVVVWRDGTDNQVRARVYDASGSPAGAAFKVDSSPNNQFAPSVGMEDSGDFTVAWQTNAAGGIQYRQFSSDGSPKGNTRSAGTGGDKDYAPSLSMNSNGGFCIAWRDDLLNAWVRAFQGNGDPIDAAFKPSQSGGDQLEPNCAYDEDGNFLVSWKYRPGSGDGSIRGRLFRSSAPPGLTVSCTADPNQGAAPLAVSFTAQASGGSGSYSYSWDFGDGDTSGAQNPSHTYTSTGTFQAIVTATSGTDTATCKKTITVGTGSGGVTVTELTKTSVDRNTPETRFSVKGTKFQNGATVSFNDPGIDVFVTNWIDSTRIKVRINTKGTAFLGLHDVTVVNPDGSHGTGAMLLKVQQNGKYPAPSIDAVDPSRVSAGSTPVLKITGQDFARDPQQLAVDAGTGVRIDTIDWISATEIHANATVAGSAACGSRDVVVSNGSASSQPCAGCLGVSSGGLSISGVKPASAHAGDGPIDVTITGCGYSSGSVAKIKGTTKVSQTVVDASTIILTIMVKPDVAPGFKKVRVQNSSTNFIARKDLFQIKP